MSNARSIPLAGALILWALLCFLAAFEGAAHGFVGHGFAVALVVFAVLSAGQIFLAAANTHERLAKWLGPREIIALPAALLALYLFYALGTGNFAWWRLGGAAVYIVLPIGLVRLAREKAALAWADYAAVLAIWFPIERHWLHKLWPYPAPLAHTLTILLALNVALASFLFIRRLDGIGYTIAWGRGFGSTVAFHFLVFAAIAIPLGEAIGFIHYGPTVARLKALPLTAVGILLFTAWPEELLFRGLLQNLLSRTLRRYTSAWVIASVIFGLSHINHDPFPNWRYVLLATIAGLFYGRAWSKTGSMTASCLVHALIDTTWHALFR